MILSVNAGNCPYDIIIESAALKKAGELFNLNRKVLVVSDESVPRKYADTVAAQCAEAHVVRFAPGEESKTTDTWSLLLTEMMNAGFTRHDCVVAVGGGVVGDVSGFAAASYMRGIDFYNIPTTLLAQVDSSVGGKTAVNMNGVKNTVGAFWQPRRVLIDPDTLLTLDSRQLHAGLAEAIKMAATSDRALFDFIKSSEDLHANLPEIIARALRIKIGFVEADPHEQGIRKALNFGHTVGHAIESAAKGSLYHGECVACGMLPFASVEAAEEIRRVLVKYELPITTEFGYDTLLPYLLHDKKKDADEITTVFVNTVGSYEFIRMTPEKIRELTEGAI